MAEPLVVGVIPARHRSVRFPGKPLAELHGRPMIQHVCERAVKAPYLDRVVVATDDERIVEAVEDFGVAAVMTSPSHTTGTDRVADAVAELEGDVIVDIQGDEPLIEPAMITQAIEPLLHDESVEVTNPIHKITETAEALDPDVVKVVTSLAGDVICYSRSGIPFPKGPTTRQMYKQIGLYGFRRKALEAFAGWGPAPLEMSENVELMRFLEHGWKVRAVETEHHTVAVDTPEDLERVRAMLDEEHGRERTYA